MFGREQTHYIDSAVSTARVPVMSSVQAEAPWFDRVLKKRIVVHLTTDSSIEGVLMEALPDGFILRAAKLLGDGDLQHDTELAGETFIPREQVSFAQLDE